MKISDILPAALEPVLMVAKEDKRWILAVTVLHQKYAFKAFVQSIKTGSYIRNSLELKYALLLGVLFCIISYERIGGCSFKIFD